MVLADTADNVAGSWWVCFAVFALLFGAPPILEAVMQSRPDTVRTLKPIQQGLELVAVVLLILFLLRVL